MYKVCYVSDLTTKVYRSVHTYLFGFETVTS